MEAPPGEKYRGVPVVTLFVGPDKIAYNVHQSILCDASNFFQAAFYGKFKESSDRSMSLPDDEIDPVERMIGWLYSAKIQLTSPVSSEAATERYWQLAKLNTLADKYDIVHLKNSIIDELYELRKSSRVPRPQVIQYVYSNTTQQSPFRKLLVAWYSHLIDLKWYEMESSRAELVAIPEFAIDLTMALGVRMAFPQRANPFAVDKSHYYYHLSREVEVSNTSPDDYTYSIGCVSSTGFLPTEPRVSKNRDTLSSSTVGVPPEETLFRRKGAPVRYEENDFYWADRHLKKGQALPESDLLKALHTYASDFYGRSTKNRGAADFESLDETALLALGILLEEMAGHVLGETGDLAFAEGEEIEEQEEDDGAGEGEQSRKREVAELSTGAASQSMPEAVGEPEKKRERKRRKTKHEAIDAG